MTAELIHRLHFAFTITFHYLFPQLTMGLALLIVVLKSAALKTCGEQWDRALAGRSGWLRDLPVDPGQHVIARRPGPMWTQRTIVRDDAARRHAAGITRRPSRRRRRRRT